MTTHLLQDDYIREQVFKQIQDGCWCGQVFDSGKWDEEMQYYEVQDYWWKFDSKGNIIIND